MKKIRLVFVILLATAVITSCRDNLSSVNPHIGKTFQEALNSVKDLKTATTGTYGLFNGIVDGYWRPYTSFILNIGTAMGDNVTQGVTTVDAIQRVFNYQRTSTDGTLAPFWKRSYKIIYSANQNIVAGNKLLNNSNLSTSEKKVVKQLKGENLFLRAKIYFDLVRVFGRPYTQNASENLGVPLVTKPDISASPPRATVKTVYKQIVNDLKKAASLMTIRKNSSYASKTVAQAYLSRVYLYMGKNQKVAEYANKVINSGRYKLLTTKQYPNLYSMGNINNPAVIFAIHHDQNQNYKFNSYSSLYYQSPSGIGWGQWFASQELVNLLNRHPNDIRKVFIEPQYIINEKGDTVGMEKLNGIKKYFITKFTGQYGIPHVSPIIYMRYAEMFLNRAEAYAKMGMLSKAIADVNKIRRRAGLVDSAMYAARRMTQKEVLDAVLRERRMEFYLEGQRGFDIFRNNRTLTRDYPVVVPEFGHLTIKPDDYRIVSPLPKKALFRNPNLKQNPGYGGR